ncbi:hypothetical protein Sp245p_23975 (plasmid) [Azospirillum baldaniorum]|uniref:O-antigen ligase domain-containing protein n=1 Tax=Azospirillum baldaniorum TaxID=1064539 RepID=A0A9P1JZ85_9PROT|nr:conserved membrane protein of unknown function [Azospirillum baldaniorum]AWJ92897.1 hypothetical protein Sp245p_23975 [Azospirillum baldaniorum]TWA76339.1 hypothetical protein FBZ85_109242 [Azospirillum brasilense]CCD02539.1 conserved membrane protein of unknown function [Azospirillum baldaniorum]
MIVELGARQRGRILSPVRVAAPRRSQPRSLTMMILLAVLPLFGQSFHYLVDVPPLYALSKSWPVLTIPLAVYALAQIELPFKSLCIALLAYLVAITPAVSMVQLGNGVTDAMATTVKVWPFAYYFSLAALLTLLRPTLPQVRGALIALGAGTFVIMLALWLVLPPEAYATDPLKSKLLMYDVERGPRIFMPMFFGVLFLFYLSRRFCAYREWWTIPLLLIGLLLMVLIYKQRTALGSVVLVVGFAMITSARGWWRILAVGMALLATVFLAAVYSVDLANRAEQMLGASLSIRQNSIVLALDFLEVTPLRWLLGVGAVTRFSNVTLADILGNNQFYLADIGWIGIVFEYGVIGAVLIAAFYVAALRSARKAATGDDPMTQALGDYVLFALATSTIYSVVFTPGEVASVMALALYWRNARRQAGAQRPLHPTKRPILGMGRP